MPAGTGLPAQPSRIELIDGLRGFALLGIIVVNVGYFASTYIGLSDPVFGGFGDDAVRRAVAFFFESKFYLLFSFLFGYSFTIQMESARREDRSFGARFLRRTLGLFLLGLIHGVLLFSGDILMIYAIAGSLLFFARNWHPSTALITGGMILALSATIWLLLGVGALDDPEAFRSDPAVLGAEAERLEAGYAAGSISEVVDTRFGELGRTFLLLLFIQGPSALALFLVGLAAGKVRALQDPGRLTRLWKRLLGFGLLLGLPGAAVYAWSSVEPALEHPARELFGLSLDILLAPALAAAYLAAIVLARDSRPGRRLIAWLAPAGRIALTNYLFQSIVLALIFTGHGFGLVGQVSPGVAVMIAIAVFIGQTAVSSLWLRNHRYGPAEWILRAFTNWSWPDRNRPESAR